VFGIYLSKDALVALEIILEFHWNFLSCC